MMRGGQMTFEIFKWIYCTACLIIVLILQITR